MSDLRKTVLLSIVGIVLTACTTVDIPKAYNFRVKETETNPYGCWTILLIKPDPETHVEAEFRGELLYMNKDSTFLLESDHHVLRFPNNRIAQAQLVTHKNQAGTYALTTGIFLVPNIIGAIVIDPAFLALGIPVALAGFIHILVEGGFERNILKYPKTKKLEEFRLFARFPGGIPENLDISSLTLKKPDR